MAEKAKFESEYLRHSEEQRIVQVTETFISFR